MRASVLRVLWLVVVLATAPAQSAEETGGLLWRLEPPDGGAPSWLYGTIHVADPRVVEVPKAVRRAIAASDIAVFELLDDTETMVTAHNAMLYEGGRRLTDVLSPAEWEQVRAIGADYGMIPTVTAMFRPFGLVMLFSTPVDQTRLMLQGGTALDVVLMEMARREGLELRALEAAEEQLAVFADMTEADQLAMLMDLVTRKAENDAAFEALLAAWLARDLGRIAREVDAMAAADGAALYDGMMERLKDDRDAVMFDRLQPMLAEGSLFIAVGTLHLIGEGGLLERFRAAGWRTVPEDGPRG